MAVECLWNARLTKRSNNRAPEVTRVGTANGTVERFTFGFLDNGGRVDGVRLENANGLTATIMSYGATLQGLTAPDRHGEMADIVLGHDELASYVSHRSFFGSTVGRVANRIACGRFELDGQECRVPCNDGAHALHGGTSGFDQRIWDIASIGAEDHAWVELRLLSVDGEEGFPGNLGVVARYGLDNDNVLTIDYWATTDRTTVVNVTNHAYWNLAGANSDRNALDHRLAIFADHYLTVDAELIPQGGLAPVSGTPFDFREAKAIGDKVRDGRNEQIARGRGYDHCWVADPLATSGHRRIATLEDPVSGRGFTLWSNQPGVQFYSGNFLDGRLAGKSGKLHRQGDAIVLEPQRLPDCVNQPGLGSARLEPGQVYHNRIEYHLTSGCAA